jgi:rhamnosyl/mannosyltransferase
VKEIRVSMLVKLYPPWVGGLESHVAQLSVAVARIPGYRVQVLTGQPQPGFAATEVRDGIEIHRAATVGRVARTPIALGLGRMLRESQPHIVHYNAPFPWGELAVPPQGTRVVVTYYHDVIRQRLLSKIYRPFLERLLRRADAIVAWSAALVDQSPVLAKFRDKITISAGGIDTRPFMPNDLSRDRAAALRLRLAPHRPLVLFVGRLVYYKGVDVLLRAMRDVNATLVVVGTGAEGGRLMRLAHDLQLGARVHFAGAVPQGELPAYYQASDMLVLPSTERTETFGLVQVEAHVSGIPAICTALPTGVALVNEHGYTGLVVPPGDATALGTAIRRLIDDSALRRRFGDQAQLRALAHYDIQRCAGDLLRVYRRVLG